MFCYFSASEDVVNGCVVLAAYAKRTVEKRQKAAWGDVKSPNKEAGVKLLKLVIPGDKTQSRETTQQ